MSNIRRAYRKGLNYGGSEGGRSNDPNVNRGLDVLKQRNQKIGELRKVFEQEGIGRFGARKEAWIAKQYDPDVQSGMVERQKNREDDSDAGADVDPV